MRDLMIRNSEGFGDGWIKQFAAILLPNGQKPGISKRPIDMDRTVDFGDAVFGENNDSSTAGARRVG